MEVMPNLEEPDASAVRGKIDWYLEKAERLEKLLEARKAGNAA